MSPVNVGERIRQLRIGLGLSVRSLATQTGFSPSLISQGAVTGSGIWARPNNASKRPLTQASLRCKRWLKPSSLHRIPTPLKRCWMSHLHALSTYHCPAAAPTPCTWHSRCARDAVPNRHAPYARCPVPSPATPPRRGHPSSLPRTPSGMPCRKRCRAQTNHRRDRVVRPSNQAAAPFHSCCAA